MTFEEILDQAIAMLQRRGRVSYRALQRQFQLDDAYLQDLTTEIVDVLRLAVDQAHTMLVWTGGPSASTPVSPPPSSLSPPDAQESPPPRALVPNIQRAPEAERRQLTVLFCDLVDSTRLSSQLDPEEYREVVRAYHKVCTEVIQRYEGHVAQLLGDGLLVYFGYPQAHEDDAHRAVRTGLGIVEAIAALNTRLEQDQGITLAVRVGIHTGLVVVGAMGSEGRQEALALGEVPNVCARIQGLAAPNTVALSAATYGLVHGYFDCEARGEQPLRGVTEPIAVYRVLRDSGAQSRWDIASARGLTPLVGREPEVGLLLARWEQVKERHGQVILLSGEAGIGKSRLVQVMKEHVANAPHTRWECRSSPYFQNTALYPFIDFFQRALQWQQDDTPAEKLATLEQTLSQYRRPVAESIPLIGSLLALPLPADRYPPLALSPERQRQKTLETIVAILLELAERQPVVLILEDLHWVDPTTLELLGLLIDHTPTASLYLLLTCRPEFQPSWHHRLYLTEVTVIRLSREQVIRMAVQVTGGKGLPAEVLQQIVDKTDGVPLFVEELTKAVLESGHLQDVDGHYALTRPLASLAIPTTLHDSLMARLDRLVTAKGIAQYAAVMGRQFAYALLATVSQLDAATLQRELGRLVDAEIVYQRGVPPQSTYVFKHALIQDAAYQSLLKSTRQHYHQRIAQALEAQFPETVATQPELLAHHYTEAGLVAQAIPYWQRAGERTLVRSAYQEATSHLTTALALLTALPESPQRSQQELTVLMTLGIALWATQGGHAPEVEHLYLRARTLCEQVGEPQQLFRVLWGLWRVSNMRGDYQRMQALGEQLLNLAQHQHDPDLLLEAHHALWTSLFSSGELSAARLHQEQGLQLYIPQRHRVYTTLYSGHDPGVCGHYRAAPVLWLLGYPDQAVASSQAALALARQLAHPLSLIVALHWAAVLHHLRREISVTQAHAEAAMIITADQGVLHGGTKFLRGWALAASGHGEEGITQLLQSLAEDQATGATRDRPYHLALLAEVSAQVGQTTTGLEAVNEALATVPQSAVRWWEAELYRLRGELLLLGPGISLGEAEACFQRALDVARHQQAKSLELRAAMSLVRLWQRQGKRTEARELLASIYGWFTEGRDTADLQDAQALLEALA